MCHGSGAHIFFEMLTNETALFRKTHFVYNPSMPDKGGMHDPLPVLPSHGVEDAMTKHRVQIWVGHKEDPPYYMTSEDGQPANAYAAIERLQLSFIAQRKRSKRPLPFDQIVISGNLPREELRRVTVDCIGVLKMGDIMTDTLVKFLQDAPFANQEELKDELIFKPSQVDLLDVGRGLLALGGKKKSGVADKGWKRISLLNNAGKMLGGGGGSKNLFLKAVKDHAAAPEADGRGHTPPALPAPDAELSKVASLPGLTRLQAGAAASGDTPAAPEAPAAELSKVASLPGLMKLKSQAAGSEETTAGGVSSGSEAAPAMPALLSKLKGANP